MARAVVTIKDADDLDRDIVCNQLASGAYIQVTNESYAVFRTTKVVLSTTSQALTDLLVAGTPARAGVLQDRAKVVIYTDPNNLGLVRYSSDDPATADSPPLRPEREKQLWIDENEEAYLIGSVDGLIAYIEEYA